MKTETTSVKNLFLFGPVKDIPIERIIKDIYTHIEDMSTKTQEERKDILIHIASGGGDVLPGLALATLILDNNSNPNSVIKIHTHIAKSAFSIAFVVWVCGEKRTLSSYAQGMYHDISGEIGRATITMQEERISAMKGNRDVIIDIIASRTNIPKKEIRTNIELSLNKYLNEEELQKIIS